MLSATADGWILHSPPSMHLSRDGYSRPIRSGCHLCHSQGWHRRVQWTAPCAYLQLRVTKDGDGSGPGRSSSAGKCGNRSSTGGPFLGGQARPTGHLATVRYNCTIIQHSRQTPRSQIDDGRNYRNGRGPLLHQVAPSRSRADCCHSRRIG